MAENDDSALKSAGAPSSRNAEFDRIISLLHGGCPYLGFEKNPEAVDLQGWGSDAPLLRQVVEKVRPAIIIEVGTWKGRSAISMAGWLKALGHKSVIICVDTWLGSPEHILNTGGAGGANDLNPRHGYPQLYYTFLNNVICSGCQDVIVPLPNASENAAVILKKHNIKADVVYIDAAHEYEPALRDLRAYWPVVRDNGVLICDDFIGWPGVTSAFGVFAKENKQHKIVATYGKALVCRNKDIEFVV